MMKELIHLLIAHFGQCFFSTAYSVWKQHFTLHLCIILEIAFFRFEKGFINWKNTFFRNFIKHELYCILMGFPIKMNNKL